MNKFSRKLYPLMLLIAGFYCIAIPYVLPVKSEISFSLLEALSQIFIIAGVVMYAFQLLQIRLERIEEQLQISKENKISNVSFVPSDNHLAFIEHIQKKRFIYKASIYLPNASIETLFFLRSFLSTVKLDSRARIVLNIYNEDENAKKNIEEIVGKYKGQIELKESSSQSNLNYYLVILDTTIWVLTNFGQDIKNNLLFNVSSYDEQGKSFIDLFNRIWTESDLNQQVTNEK